jgi:2-methylcitrate dehydratase PrpD
MVGRARQPLVELMNASTSLPGLLGEAAGRIPDDVMHSARLHFLDALAVGLAGSRLGPVSGVHVLADNQGAGRSTVIGSSRPAPAPIAALINGTLIHSLEYDDTHVASVTHGSSIVASAAFAVAEQLGLGGRQTLSAYAVGWEFLIRLGLASPGRIQANGFQITSAAGAFASAAVSCLLNNDAPGVFANAIGIAGSQAAGTFAFLADGATVKAAQPGWAAHSGLLAAELARAGVTGPRDVFDGPFGFYTLYAGDASGGSSLTTLLPDLGDVWHLPEAAFKLRPCCHYIHPFVEALELLTLEGASFDNVVSLHCWVPAETVPIIAEPWRARQRPVKPHDARWSLPYVLGTVLLHGDLTLSDFDGACDDGVMAFSERITYEPWADSGYPSRFPARLQATLSDGTVLEASVDDVRGSPTRPVNDRDVLRKAMANLIVGGLTEHQSRQFADELLVARDPDLGMVGQRLRLQCDT